MSDPTVRERSCRGGSTKKKVAEGVDGVGKVGRVVSVRVRRGDAARSPTAEEKPIQRADHVGDVDVSVVVAIASEEALRLEAAKDGSQDCFGVHHPESRD